MIVMVSNNSGAEARRLAVKYRPHVGHLYSPDGQRGPFEDFREYAGDNGAYGGLNSDGTVRDGFDEAKWVKHIRWLTRAAIAPRWVLVPDKPCDCDETLRRWERYAHTARVVGVPLAIAVQDGMTPEHIPDGAEVIFVGGSTEWKWRTAGMWTRAFSRVHLARVNGYDGLRLAEGFGVESVDGTGWFRGDQNQLNGLKRYLAELTGEIEREPAHPTLF